MTENNIRSISMAINQAYGTQSYLIFAEFDSSEFKSYFDIKKRIVCLDLRYLDGKEMNGNKPSELEIKAIAALAHEKRHIYQSDNLTDKWKWEFDNYKNPEDGYEEYMLQEIEVDANAFARIFIEHLFKKNIMFPNKIEVAVEDRARILRELYGVK